MTNKEDIKKIVLHMNDGTKEEWQVVSKQKGHGDQLIIQKKKDIRKVRCNFCFEVEYDAEIESEDDAVNRTIKEIIYTGSALTAEDVYPEEIKG